MKLNISLNLQKTGKILIMDDEVEFRNTLIRLFKSYGYLAIGAKDGSEAIKLLRNSNAHDNSYAAALLDLTIPNGMGGEETLKEIKKFNPHLPIFVMSGYADNSIMADPEKYGFAGSLNKPFKSDELIEILQAI